MAPLFSASGDLPILLAGALINKSFIIFAFVDWARIGGGGSVVTLMIIPVSGGLISGEPIDHQPVVVGSPATIDSNSIQVLCPVASIQLAIICRRLAARYPGPLRLMPPPENCQHAPAVQGSP